MDDRIHTTEASDYHEMVMEYFVNKPLDDYVKSRDEFESVAATGDEPCVLCE